LEELGSPVRRRVPAAGAQWAKGKAMYTQATSLPLLTDSESN